MTLDSDPIPVVMTVSSRKVLGLNMNLWRLALVTGVAQFSMSLWAWEFTIFLQKDVGLVPWQIGAAMSIGTLAMIIGYMASGIISDFIGRKNTMVVSFIPIALGLFGMWYNPTWPFVAFEYGIVYFGFPRDELAVKFIAVSFSFHIYLLSNPHLLYNNVYWPRICNWCMVSVSCHHLRVIIIIRPERRWSRRAVVSINSGHSRGLGDQIAPQTFR